MVENLKKGVGISVVYKDAFSIIPKSFFLFLGFDMKTCHSKGVSPIIQFFGNIIPLQRGWRGNYVADR